MIKYYLKIITTSYFLSIQKRKSGFALPLAVGMGLVMIIVAASMIGRSQSDQITTNSQRETNRALSVAEAGIIRVQSFLDRYKLLATKNLDQWVNTVASLPLAQANCKSIDLASVKQQSEIFKSNNWINLDQKDLNKGRYRITNYEYQNGIGKLTIAGEINAYNNTQNGSKSSLAVEIPIGNESANIAPPALWANTFNLSPNQRVTGEIRGVSCSDISSTDPDGVAGVDLINIALINGISTGQIIADPFTTIPPPKTAPTTAISIPAILTSIQFPRPNSIDLPDPSGEYHYLVNIDNLKSGYSIKLQDTDSIELNLANNQKVNLYLKGNIDFSGSKTLNVNSSHPNLRIYGSTETTKLTIKNSASITAFIHAPFATAKSITATVLNPDRNITGGLWVNRWDSSESLNEFPIIQSGNWSDFGISKVDQPAQISPVSYWRRVGS